MNNITSEYNRIKDLINKFKGDKTFAYLYDIADKHTNFDMGDSGFLWQSLRQVHVPNDNMLMQVAISNLFVLVCVSKFCQKYRGTKNGGLDIVNGWALDSVFHAGSDNSICIYFSNENKKYKRHVITISLILNALDANNMALLNGRQVYVSDKILDSYNSIITLHDATIPIEQLKQKITEWLTAAK